MAKSLSSREVIKRLKAGGWEMSRTKGDHRTYKYPTNPALITITHPVKDIPVGALRNIFRIAGWDWPP